MICYCDFDGTVVNAMKRLVDILNARYNMDIDWKTVKKYDLSDKFPVDKEDILEIFNDEFFINLDQYLMPRVNNYLDKISNVRFISLGNHKNISLKSQFVSMFPSVKQSIFMASDEGLLSKGLIDMEGHILIEDFLDNLKNSNASHKILFSQDGVKTEFNNYLKNKEGYHVCTSWKEVYEVVEKIKGGR